MLAEVESLRKSLNIYKGLVEVSGLINSITDYDELLEEGYDRDSARHFVAGEIGAILGGWGVRRRLSAED